MKDFEEMNQRFRRLLKSIENNNQAHFPKPGSIFDTYIMVKCKDTYTIKVTANLPQPLVIQIEAAFLHAGANE
jgi:hypothetical protein